MPSRINEGEVFRFLTKPCPPDKLRETVALAASVAQQGRAAAAAADPEPTLDMHRRRGAEEAEVLTPPAAPNAAARGITRERLAQGLGIVVFSTDEEVLTVVQQAVRGRLPVYSASNIVKVVKILTEQRPGVLLTDISDDKATIQAMPARLKEHLPELVTIAVSPHRDVLDMVWLINHGQIFRFLRKPLSAGRCAVCLQAALKHHRMLLKNPALVPRYQVDRGHRAHERHDGKAQECPPVLGLGLRRRWPPTPHRLPIGCSGSRRPSSSRWVWPGS